MNPLTHEDIERAKSRQKKAPIGSKKYARYVDRGFVDKYGEVEPVVVPVRNVSVLYSFMWVYPPVEDAVTEVQGKGIKVDENKIRQQYDVMIYGVDYKTAAEPPLSDIINEAIVLTAAQHVDLGIPGGVSDMLAGCDSFDYFSGVFSERQHTKREGEPMYYTNDMLLYDDSLESPLIDLTYTVAWWLNLSQKEKNNVLLQLKNGVTFLHPDGGYEDYPDIARNSTCFCGSGKKFKYCCMD